MGREQAETGKSRAPLRVRVLRRARSFHGLVALPLLILVIVSSATGILLGWKKNVDVLQPPTRTSAAADLGEWLELDELAAAATAALAAEIGSDDPERLVPERLDVRPGKGVVKVRFPGTWEVQVAGGTAEIRSVARRHSDWIEKLHDGSIISEGFKLVTMSALGVGLIVLSLTGFWLWLGPKRLRRLRARDDRTGGRRKAA
ncbi:MAG: PepSY-associated TM helix domain-containing protein [Gemmatimonadota bacterium]